MATTEINYAKYENMTKRQAFFELEKTERQLDKIIEKYKAEISQKKQLIKFLQTKMNAAITKKTRYEFIPYDEARKSIKVNPPFTEAEIEQAKKEVDELVNKDYGDEL